MVSLVTGLRSLEAITLILPVVCLGYLVMLGRGAAKRALVRLPPALARLSDEVIVFTTALCLGAVVAGSDAGKGLSRC